MVKEPLDKSPRQRRFVQRFLGKSTRGGRLMIGNPRTKRRLSLSLLVLGGLLMFLAPENIWIGAVLFVLGIAVEIAGAMLGQSRKPRE